ncbi:MAG: D-alanyl-D-alanine carboxypeptidase [Pseudomonadota bacterium]|nr:D-alanyl-D-alanine carboxypeptidase [Pseudomonadota bacterium]
MIDIGRRLGRVLSHVVLGLALLTAPVHAAPTFETSAPYAILVAYDTGTVLFEKNADQLTPPASMAKLMTMAAVFRELKEGRLTLEHEFTVSENAWRRGGASSGGSSMFLPLGSRVKLVDLIQGVIVQSGNDACIVIAEGLAGSEGSFAEMMNRRAKEIGLTRSRFTNSHGLPDPEQKVTVRELAMIAAHIIREYPEYYKYYSQEEFTFNNIRQRSRNPLLSMGIGADGLKTGYTAESGYGLVGSALRGDQRLIVVVNGLRTAKERAHETRKLLEWGFRAFQQITLFPAGEIVGEAKVYGGAQSRVPLVGESALKMLLPRGGAADISAEVVYEGPIQAPVEKGQRIGVLRVTNAGRVVQEMPLYAAEDVGRGSIARRAWDAVAELVLSRI